MDDARLSEAEKNVVGWERAVKPWILPFFSLSLSIIALAISLNMVKAGNDASDNFSNPPEGFRYLSTQETDPPAGSLGYAIRKSANKDGWDVIWRTDIHPPAPSKPFDPKTSDFVSWAILALEHSNPALRAMFYHGNKVLVVTATQR